MALDMYSDIGPEMNNMLKAFIDQAWLDLDTNDTGGEKPSGRWREDS